MPVRVVITQGTTADCTQASRLIEGITAEYLLADRGYDSDAIVEQARTKGMNPVIPPRRNRKTQRDYDPELYRLRHIVENAFYISNDGAVSPRAMPKLQHPSLPPFKSDVSLFGLVSCDDII